MDENVSLLLVGLMEVAKTDQERAKVDALSERCRKEGPSALRKFMQEEPMILRLLDVAYGKEVVDIALGKAAEKMGVDLDDLLKKTVAKRGHFHFSENPGQIIRLSRPSFSVMRQGCAESRASWRPRAGRKFGERFRRNGATCPK
jgi:hypothetical protein